MLLKEDLCTFAIKVAMSKDVFNVVEGRGPL